MTPTPALVPCPQGHTRWSFSLGRPTRVQDATGEAHRLILKDRGRLIHGPGLEFQPRTSWVSSDKLYHISEPQFIF